MWCPALRINPPAPALRPKAPYTGQVKSYPRSSAILEKNRRYIPGGVVSVNRATQPAIAFARGEGPWIWDVDGNRYLDYHVAFAPHFLGHNDPHVSQAVRRVLD